MWDASGMDATSFAPGERLVWRHQPRGGYGYIWPVFVRQGPKRGLDRWAPVVRSGTKCVWVSPDAQRRPKSRSSRPIEEVQRAAAGVHV